MFLFTISFAGDNFLEYVFHFFLLLLILYEKIKYNVHTWNWS